MLQAKIDRALRLLSAASIKANRPIEICYSGGKDSDVILELARMAGIPYRAIYKNTTIDPPGTIKHVLNQGAEIIKPAMTFGQLIQKKGLPNRWRRFCCSILKEYKVLDYAVLGVRRDESVKRRIRYQEPEVCRVYGKGVTARQYFPILDWDNMDVERFITQRSIQCHPLYYDNDGRFHVERRLGCLCCPLIYTPKRIEEFKRYPRMLLFYYRNVVKYFDTNHKSKIKDLYKGNVFDFLTANIYCHDFKDIQDKFNDTPLFGNDAIDTKSFLESQFNVKF